jgi:RNA polymerase sigma factor (TIGR02999 family)
LVDHAREKGAVKRGGDLDRSPLEEAIATPVPDAIDMLAIDLALTDLEAFDPEKVRLVELRYFVGLSVPETAEILGVSPMTVKRQWTIARAWLYERLGHTQFRGPD